MFHYLWAKQNVSDTRCDLLPGKVEAFQVAVRQAVSYLLGCVFARVSASEPESGVLIRGLWSKYPSRVVVVFWASLDYVLLFSTQVLR